MIPPLSWPHRTSWSLKKTPLPKKALDTICRDPFKKQKTVTLLAIIRDHARRDFSVTLIWKYKLFGDSKR
jgi:hypothetical protein